MSRPPLKLNPSITLIKAGAGAGKTTALIRTLVHNILDYYKKYKIFPNVAVSTFTKKATRELKERLLKTALELEEDLLVEYISYSNHLQIATMHGLFKSLIDVHGYKVGISPHSQVALGRKLNEEFKAILKKVLLEQKIGLKLLDHYSFSELMSVLKEHQLFIQTNKKTYFLTRSQMQMAIDKRRENKKIKKLDRKELSIEQEKMDVYIELQTELQNLSHAVLDLWNQRKSQLNQLSLNDIEIITFHLIQKYPNCSSWDFLFLDEYQDTSPLQKDILNCLSKNCSVFIVGDPQQSIYHFRGADVSVFDEKEKEITGKANAKIQQLTINYRSDPELVAFFNDFFASSHFKQMSPIVEECDPLKSPAEFIFIDSNTETIRQKEQKEISAVKKKILQLLEKGERPENISVLAQKNKILQELARQIKVAKIPVCLHSAGQFKRRREILDAVFLWQFLLNPHDDENLIGLFRSPYVVISDAELALLIEEKQKVKHSLSLWSFLEQSKTPKSGQAKNVVCILSSFLKDCGEKGLISSFQKALIHLGFMDLSYYQDPTGMIEANLWKLIYLLRDYEKQDLLYQFTNDFFYEDIYSETEAGTGNAVSAIERSGVQLMTIHASKGLEFPHVILMGVTSGFSSSQRQRSYFTKSQKDFTWTLSAKTGEDKRQSSAFQKNLREEEQDRELDEFKRLFYVAVTRAKKTISFICCGMPKKNSWQELFPFFKKAVEIKTNSLEKQRSETGKNEQSNVVYSMDRYSISVKTL